MNSFYIGLQFLTRLYCVRQTEWTAENFGRSVKFFTVIGAILGALTAAAAYALTELLPHYVNIAIPPEVTASLLVLTSILLTGALHCDGFMDTMDGIFSGRDRNRMLKIMKDSRVGANGVISCVMLILLKWSIIANLPTNLLLAAVYAAPVLGRLAMVMSITLFPYARPEGIGKAFAQYSGKRSLLAATAIALALTLPLGSIAATAALAVVVFAALFCRYVVNLLGGVTGDVYGAVTELSELLVLAVFLCGK